MEDGRLPDDHIVAIGARITTVVIAVALAVASLCPPAWLPRLLYSNNLEHFAAFYILALTLSAARYRTRLVVIMRDAALLATALEAARWLLPGPRQGNINHWIADLGGVLAAAAPLVVSAFRRSFRYCAD